MNICRMNRAFDMKQKHFLSFLRAFFCWNETSKNITDIIFQLFFHNPFSKLSYVLKFRFSILSTPIPRKSKKVLKKYSPYFNRTYFTSKLQTTVSVKRSKLETFTVFFNSYFGSHIENTGAQLWGEGGEASPALFWKLKKVPWFWKKCLDCVHPLVKFAIQIVALRVSKRKNSKIFPCRAFFLDFFIKCLWSALISRNLPFP